MSELGWLHTEGDEKLRRVTAAACRLAPAAVEAIVLHKPLSSQMCGGGHRRGDPKLSTASQSNDLYGFAFGGARPDSVAIKEVTHK